MLGLGKEAVIEYAKKKGPVTVRGWKAGEQGFLLTDKPRAPLLPLTPGQEAVIRMEHKGILYGIAVTYRESLGKTDLCYFSFQDDVIARKLREDERLPCLLPLVINSAESHLNSQDSGMIVDLGRQGIRFVTRFPLHTERGDMLLASFHPGGMGTLNRQKMRLIRIGGYGNRMEYAAQFVDMGEEHAKLLDGYFAFCKDWAL